MRLVMIAAVAVLALAGTAAFAQEQSPPTNAVGSGTAKALEPGAPHMVGKPVSPSTAGNSGLSQRRKATTMRPRPGSAPASGSEKPEGTTGAPPYGGSTPNPNSSGDDTPHGG
jgi:hypothetical protein